MNQAVIGLGSNIDPKKNIQAAKEALRQRFSVLKESDFIETKPVNCGTQPNFINGAVLLMTDWDQDRLKSELRGIEDVLGRTRGADKNAPRTIDLDVVVWNNRIVDKDYYHRDFLKQLVDQVLEKREVNHGEN